MRDSPYYLGEPREVIRVPVGGMQESMVLSEVGSKRLVGAT